MCTDVIWLLWKWIKTIIKIQCLNIISVQYSLGNNRNSAFFSAVFGLLYCKDVSRPGGRGLSSAECFHVFWYTEFESKLWVGILWIIIMCLLILFWFWNILIDSHFWFHCGKKLNWVFTLTFVVPLKESCSCFSDAVTGGDLQHKGNWRSTKAHLMIACCHFEQTEAVTSRLTFI